VGLERSPLSLVSTLEEVLGRKSSGSGLESREDGRRDPSRIPRVSGNFADKRRLLGQCSSLVDQGHGACRLFLVTYHRQNHLELYDVAEYSQRFGDGSDFICAKRERRLPPMAHYTN
jgi:hypothetical protein